MLRSWTLLQKTNGNEQYMQPAYTRDTYPISSLAGVVAIARLRDMAIFRLRTPRSSLPAENTARSKPPRSSALLQRQTIWGLRGISGQGWSSLLVSGHQRDSH